MSLVLVAACSSDGADDPAAALAARLHDVLASSGGGDAVVARLESQGVDVSASALADGTPLCPRVSDPRPGDRATCRLTVGEQRVEVDVEFGEDGSIQVVDAEVAP